MGQQRPTHPTVAVDRMAQSGTGPHLIAVHRSPLGTVRVAVAQAEVVSVLVGQVVWCEGSKREETIPEQGVSRGSGRGVWVSSREGSIGGMIDRHV